MHSMKFVVLLLIIHSITAPPVSQNKQTEHEEDASIENLEYSRYLREVVNALESDPEFKKKLEAADSKDIRSGKIAEQLEFVSHHIRTKLDEIKRIELDRLKQLTKKKQMLEKKLNLDDPVHHHLDHENKETFEIEDLKKLIVQTNKLLEEADRTRREQFKEYELQKELERQEKLNHTANGKEREELQKKLEDLEQKHKKHEPLHEPGHKAQLQEVWEEQDHMQDQEFDPKSFFLLHDIDGNGLWDQDEVKALFIKELNKMYQQGAPEDDMRERAEEMERMRESVFNEVDTNRDGFIDFNEFIAQTKTPDFNQDHGWKGLDEQKPYTDEELAEYIRQHHPEQYQPPPPAYHPAAQQFQPGQMPQMHPQQLPPGYNHPNSVYGNNAPPGQGYQQNQGVHPPPHVVNQQYQQQQQFAAPPPGNHPNMQQFQQPHEQQYQQQVNHQPSYQQQQQVNQHPNYQQQQQVNQPNYQQQQQVNQQQYQQPSQQNQQFQQQQPNLQQNNGPVHPQAQQQLQHQPNSVEKNAAETNQIHPNPQANAV